MEIKINSINEIGAAAQQFASQIKKGDVYAFYGSMGAGKTTFIKAVCDVLGVSDVVTSPTFAIVNEYTSDVLSAPVYHFDFYRIKKLDEVYDMGYEDYFYGNGVCMIEWPELVENLLPEEVIKVSITEESDGTRTVKY